MLHAPYSLPSCSYKFDHNQRNVIFLGSISLKSAKSVNDSFLNFFCGFGGVFANDLPETVQAEHLVFSLWVLRIPSVSKIITLPGVQPSRGVKLPEKVRPVPHTWSGLRLQKGNEKLLSWWWPFRVSSIKTMVYCKDYAGYFQRRQDRGDKSILSGRGCNPPKDKEKLLHINQRQFTILYCLNQQSSHLMII